MKIIILALLLFSSFALSKEVDYDLIKSDLDLVSSAIARMRVLKDEAEHTIKLRAIQSILKDLDERLSKTHSSCDDIDRFQVLIKRFNGLAADYKVDQRPYYGDGRCSAEKRDACALSKELILTEDSSYYAGAEVCISLINGSDKRRYIWLSEEVENELEDVLKLNLQYISAPEIIWDEYYKPIVVSRDKSGVTIDLGSHSSFNKMERLFKSIGRVLDENMFDSKQFYSFEIRKVDIKVITSKRRYN